MTPQLVFEKEHRPVELLYNTSRNPDGWRAWGYYDTVEEAKAQAEEYLVAYAVRIYVYEE